MSKEEESVREIVGLDSREKLFCFSNGIQRRSWWREYRSFLESLRVSMSVIKVNENYENPVHHK